MRIVLAKLSTDLILLALRSVGDIEKVLDFFKALYTQATEVIRWRTFERAF